MKYFHLFYFTFCCRVVLRILSARPGCIISISLGNMSGLAQNHLLEVLKCVLFGTHGPSTVLIGACWTGFSCSLRFSMISLLTCSNPADFVSCVSVTSPELQKLGHCIAVVVLPDLPLTCCVNTASLYRHLALWCALNLFVTDAFPSFTNREALCNGEEHCYC